jgi:hypothetical protein
LFREDDLGSFRDASRVEGKATHGQFQQFQVKVDENIAPIKDREEKW